MARTLSLALLCLLGSVAAHAAIPTGRLPGSIKPTAYRISVTADPAQKSFSGHTEIDAVLYAPARTIFLHGNSLRVSKAQVTVGQKTLDAKYKEVHESGVAQLDLPSDVPAGKLTLTFDYAADFRTGAEGLFHAQVGNDWYAWTQMEPIDARRMFPSFDEPGFKTPFTVTVSAPKNLKVFANTPEVSSRPSGANTVHHFAPTQPLPTYLVAIGIGPFEVIESTIPANAVRKHALPWRVIATKGQKARMQTAATEGPKLLALIEKYLGVPYPFEKLDLLGTPILGGAMENAGLIIQDDTLMLLDSNAPLPQVRAFAEVTAHEMAHQWFGDLVTPAWWTDIWLNESFAEWMGKKASDQWRPELGIAVSELEEAFTAMGTDSLSRARPIRQNITENRQIASAFDEITYQKGAQVLTMFESYLGTEKFSQGVRRHLERYKHGNATADDFFRSLGEAAGDPKIVSAMRTFTDQTGVPVVTVSQSAQAITLSQARYRPLGDTSQATQTWNIPLCLSAGASRSCMLLDKQSITVPALPGNGALMPNAGGAGYYRFRMDDAKWDRLLSGVTKLSAQDALTIADSIWADFTAGTGSFDQVIAAARALASHPQRLPATELGNRLQSLSRSALTPQQLPQYRKAMQSIYGPRFSMLGFNPRPGAYKNESAEKQALRESLLPFIALEARDPELRTRLSNAADNLLNGDPAAIDPAFRVVALTVGVQDRGAPFMTKLRDAMVRSSDPLFRRNATEALGAADTAATAETAMKLALSQGVQSMETVQIVIHSASNPGARDTTLKLVDQNFDRVIHAFPGFARPVIMNIFYGQCSTADVAKVEAFVKPKLQVMGGGDLELELAKERISRCAALKSAKGGEIGAVLAKAAT